MSKAAATPISDPQPSPEGSGAHSKSEGQADEFPKRFGKYTLLRRLAVGGMAELFIALQRSVAGFEKLIVVKRILPRLSSDQAFVDMLVQEARIAATLTHPNIAQVYDIGVEGGDYYIAMEHVHGEDLRSIVRQMQKKQVRTLPIEHSIAIALGCCKGLAHAHQGRDLDGNPLEIVHRDVSPQNILVTFTGEVKLVDFGIAKATTSGDEEHTKLKGKAAYMSPEQVQRLPLDGRSDLFSLGTLLFELTTGRRLFKAASDMETFERIIHGQVPKASSLNPNLPPALEAIIEKALAVDRDDRYASADEMQADLEALVREQQLVVSPLSLGEWMKDLFDDKLAEQKRMLQEGRQLAEVLAEQWDEERSISHSGVSLNPRTQPAKRWPIYLLLSLLIAGGAAAAYFIFASRPTAGTLSIRTEPPGASVWIDEELRGVTPLEVEGLPFGERGLRVAMDGYEPHSEMITLSQAQPRISVRPSLVVEAEPVGGIQVTSAPPGAELLVDGERQSERTPSLIGGLRPGEHTLVVSLAGYLSKTLQVQVTSNGLTESHVELERAPLREGEAWVRFEVDAENARVVLDGEAVPNLEARTTAGRHEVEVSAPGRRSSTLTVQLRSQEEKTVAVELAHLRRNPTQGSAMMDTASAAQGPGALTFDARPWCNVSVDGRGVGQTPVVNLSLPAGQHTIVCANPEHGTRRVRVTISEGQTTRQRVDLTQ